MNKRQRKKLCIEAMSKWIQEYGVIPNNRDWYDSMYTPKWNFIKNNVEWPKGQLHEIAYKYHGEGYMLVEHCLQKTLEGKHRQFTLAKKKDIDKHYGSIETLQGMLWNYMILKTDESKIESKVLREAIIDYRVYDREVLADNKEEIGVTIQDLVPYCQHLKMKETNEIKKEDVLDIALEIHEDGGTFVMTDIERCGMNRRAIYKWWDNTSHLRREVEEILNERRENEEV